jgi:glutamate formiminotransferase
MRLLAVTHWSFGRDKDLLRAMREIVDAAGVHLHDIRTDPDLNRTSVVFSADHELIRSVVVKLAGEALPRIDLGRHTGTHSRTGGLDACSLIIPFRDPTRQEMEYVQGTTELLAATIAARYELPVFLTDRAARAAEADTLEIRDGGFGSLTGQMLAPDFGPSAAHPQLGVTMIGIRDFFLTFQIDFESPNGGFARTLEREAKDLRTAGDPHFLGAEASAFSLTSRDRARLSIEMDLPDLASPDPIIEWAVDSAARAGIRAFGAELAGAIRVSDLPGATRLSVRDQQILG